MFSARNRAAFSAGYQLYNLLDNQYRKYNNWYWQPGNPGNRRGLKFTKPSGVSTNTTLARSVSSKRRYSKMPYRRVVRRRYRRKSRAGRYPKPKRRWQSRARMMVGQPRNHSSTKTTESVLPGGTISVLRNGFSSLPLIQIGSTTTNSINDRQRDQCVVSGIKLNIAFENLYARRLWVNWAVIHPKQGQFPGAANDDFFRDYNNNRAWNTQDTGKTGLSWAVAQINSDEYLVMKRGKFMLTPNSTGGLADGYNTKDVTKDVSCWIKLGRTFNFDDGSTFPQDQIYFVCWAADSNEAAGAVIGQGMVYRLRAICYFREPKQG